MAPFISATVQFLLASVRMGTQPHKTTEQNLGCQRTHDKAISFANWYGPSLSAISWGLERQDVFGQDEESGNTKHKYWDGYQWGPSVQDLEDLGNSPGYGGPPSAISRNTSLIECVQLIIISAITL